MIDNKPQEDQAESLVKFSLHEAGIKHGKPAFDQQGADLLILDNLDQKFSTILKVQVKYRAISVEKVNNVTIDISYVTDNFLCFVYVTGIDQPKLYIFFPEDFKEWHKGEKKYTLQLSAKKMPDYISKVFNNKAVERIEALLLKQPIKKYTSLIIDGIFLRQAIQTMFTIYDDLYPDIRSQKPSLEVVVKQLLVDYNRYPDEQLSIHAHIFISNEFPLDSLLAMPKESFFRSKIAKGVKIHIYNTKDMLLFDVLDHLDRTVNTENVILAANDIGYQGALSQLQKKGVDIILLTVHTDQGRQIYTESRWGDIIYPLARTFGVIQL